MRRLFGPERARCAVMAYDYTVLAGTQGYFNHRKSDRLLEIWRAAARCRWCCLPKAAAGGRAMSIRSSSPGLHCTTFQRFARL